MDVYVGCDRDSEWLDVVISMVFATSIDMSSIKNSGKLGNF